MDSVQVEQKSYEMPPRDGMSIAHFITVTDIQRSLDYYDTYRLMAAFVTAMDKAVVPAGHSCTTKPVQF